MPKVSFEKECGSQVRNLFQWHEDRGTPKILHPAVFISASVALGFLFAIQEWAVWRRMGAHTGIQIFALVHCLDYFLWGSICWSLWATFEDRIRRAGIPFILLGILPLSILISVGEEMLILFLLPNIPVNRPHMPFWHRVSLFLYDDFLKNMVTFWFAFFLFRGIAYYQMYRKQEQAASQLATQLAIAQLSALRMQLNPHFLFNAMNSISSLMRIDIDAADTMLEQLSCLLRITLERGDAQLISMRDEIEFVETYMAMQAQRYAGRVQQSLSIDPELHDALVPTMLLQPIVENAFMHGLSKISAGGELSVAAHRDGEYMTVRVVNSGIGLDSNHSSNGHGVGISNIKDRLRLHYGDTSSLTVTELDPRRVQVTIRLPLQFSSQDPRVESQ